MYLYNIVFVVPHTWGAQAWIIQFYLQISPCLPLPRQCSPDGATTDLWWHPSNCSLLLIYQPWKDERLRSPSCLTYNGWFAHISGHPSAVARVHDRESSPVKDPRSTAVPRNETSQRHLMSWCACHALSMHTMLQRENTMHRSGLIHFTNSLFNINIGQWAMETECIQTFNTAIDNIH